MDMTTRYQKSQIEDVAYIFAGRGMPDIVRVQLTGDFADLFTADNPTCCVNCGDIENTPVCTRPNEGHNFSGGFNRERFLAACGLESEG